MPSNHLILSHPLLLLPSNFLSIRSFQMSQLSAWGGQSIAVSPSPSVLPVNTQDWFPLGWTGCISLQSKGLSRESLNTEFQRIARRDKKDFLSDQCKEIEENNRMGKTTDLFEKIWDRKGIFHAKMGTINNRNGMDQQKQKILRRSGKNTQKNYTKISMTQIITMVWWLTKSQTSWNVKSTSLRKHY